MKIIIDSADIEQIAQLMQVYNVAGVTTNPSILAKQKGDPTAILQTIRKHIGEKELHVQILSQDFETMLQEAKYIVQHFGAKTYIKVPVNAVGLQCIRYLKAEGYNITATAIYTVEQAMLAASVGADYVAPYFNRMLNIGTNPEQAIVQMRAFFDLHHLPTQILAASFKAKTQVTQALLAGAHAVTVQTPTLEEMLQNEQVKCALQTFAKDFETAFGFTHWGA
ncbi:MAG: transaldolase family protein [Eubacteriales bacterium]|nr:transaldolase family protein [Eubacteriales bacterium]